MRKRACMILFVALLLSAVGGCGGDDTSVPATVVYEGTYNAQVKPDSYATTCDATLTAAWQGTSLVTTLDNGTVTIAKQGTASYAVATTKFPALDLTLSDATPELKALGWKLSGTNSPAFTLAGCNVATVSTFAMGANIESDNTQHTEFYAHDAITVTDLGGCPFPAQVCKIEKMYYGTKV